MNKLLDKLILLALCMAVFIQHNHGIYAVAAVIAAVFMTASFEIIRGDRLRAAAFLIYAVSGVFFPGAIYFLPLLCFDAYPSRALAACAVPLLAHIVKIDPVAFTLTVVYILLALMIKRQSMALDKQRQERIALRDSTKELLDSLRRKNRELLEKQDYELNLATLNERSRIARDMHDTVGHLLSSSILQIGALLANERDAVQKESLRALKDTLSQGMDSVRSAIHDLHDESVDLYGQTRAMIDGFSFCPALLEYDVDGSPEPMVKYAFLFIIKEALNNIARHSDAAQARVVIREHPALYQLVVRDDGKKPPAAQSEGLGLKNIRDRAESLGGVMHIRAGEGFELFVSIPKKAAGQRRQGE